MINTTNEFEIVPAFTSIAGSNLGTWSKRDVIFELIRVIEVTASASKRAITIMYKELAAMSESDLDDQFAEFSDEMIDILKDNMPIPTSCVIDWVDNEIMVVPYIDEDIPRYDEVPETLNNGEYDIYQVSDHGNVSLYSWNDQKREYIEQWSMV